MTAWAAPQNFKHQVLLKVQGGQSIPSVAQELGISEGIIYQWKEKMGNPVNNRVSKSGMGIRYNIHTTQRRKMGLFSSMDGFVHA